MLTRLLKEGASAAAIAKEGCTNANKSYNFVNTASGRVGGAPTANQSSPTKNQYEGAKSRIDTGLNKDTNSGMSLNSIRELNQDSRPVSAHAKSFRRKESESSEKLKHL